MKRILSWVVALFLLLPVTAKAGVLEAVSHRMRDSSNTLMTSYAITSGATIYTEALPIPDNGGYLSLLAVEDKAGGAGSVSISAEYSVDGTTFYTVYTSSGGTLTADSAIVTTLANSSRYIQATARLGKFIRLKVVASADSQVTLDILWARTR